MKGGGFLVLLFLLFCFLWGVGAVMGGLRRMFASWGRSEGDAPARSAVRNWVDVVDAVPVRQPPAGSSPAGQIASSGPSAMAPALAATARPSPVAMDLPTALQHMREAHALHREGVLTEQEFAQIKSRLIAQIGAAPPMQPEGS